MNRRAILVVAALVILAGLVWWALRPGGGPRPAPTPVSAEAVETPTPAPEQRVMLLFPGADGRLHPVLRTVALPAELDERARVVVLELLAGPGRGGLLPAVPWAAELLGIFVDGRGTVYVDLTGPPEPLAGSTVELMTAYSIVDSVLLNCPELHRLQILLDGREIPTLTGHLDLSRPLPVNTAFISPS